jgi:hypothetical protein
MVWCQTFVNQAGIAGIGKSSTRGSRYVDCGHGCRQFLTDETPFCIHFENRQSSQARSRLAGQNLLFLEPTNT